MKTYKRKRFPYSANFLFLFWSNYVHDFHEFFLFLNKHNNKSLLGVVYCVTHFMCVRVCFCVVCVQDKVANTWCSLNVLIKIKTLLSRDTQLLLR